MHNYSEEITTECYWVNSTQLLLSVKYTIIQSIFLQLSPEKNWHYGLNEKKNPNKQNYKLQQTL